MIVHRFEGGPFQENGYLLVEGRTAVVVDPGGGADGMVALLREEDLTVSAILLTHAHLDHVDGLHRIREVAPDAPIHLHPADRPLYDAVSEQAAWFGLRVAELPPPDRTLHDGQHLELGGIALDVRFAPGHAPGHVIFVAPSQGWALVGDVIFRGSIGRTDLPGGDSATLMASIQEQILTLPDEMRLLPGHGPETTVATERRSNPFVLELSTG